MRQGIGHLRLAAGAVGPNMLLETLLRGELGDAGKVLGHILLLCRQHIHA